MDSRKTVRINLGAPMFTVTTVFVVLKLTGLIDWSWWWVLSPFWIMALFFVLLFAIVYGAGGRR